MRLRFAFDSNCTLASWSPGEEARTEIAPATRVVRTSAVAIPASARIGLAKIVASPISAPFAAHGKSDHVVGVGIRHASGRRADVGNHAHPVRSVGNRIDSAGVHKQLNALRGLPR